MQEKRNLNALKSRFLLNSYPTVWTKDKEVKCRVINHFSRLVRHTRMEVKSEKSPAWPPVTPSRKKGGVKNEIKDVLSFRKTQLSSELSCSINDRQHQTGCHMHVNNKYHKYRNKTEKTTNLFLQQFFPVEVHLFIDFPTIIPGVLQKQSTPFMKPTAIQYSLLHPKRH
jgi:hypothetical protein